MLRVFLLSPMSAFAALVMSESALRSRLTPIPPPRRPVAVPTPKSVDRARILDPAGVVADPLGGSRLPIGNPTPK